MNILVSACLLGVPCRYDGKAKASEAVLALGRKHNLIPVCPEVMGGLDTPRPPAERVGAYVLTKDGRNVTAQYQKGAVKALELARLHNCTYALLKEKSPSCGKGKIYDGNFSGNLVKGDGVTAYLLSEAGIKVLGESDIDRLL